jgi:hypothetical protein
MSNPAFTAPNYANQVGTTYKGNIDNAIASAPWYVNLGVTYSAGTITLHGADGTALSSTNPGFVKFQSKANPGQLISVSLEANKTFIDDAGASEIVGNLFGTTTSVAWADAMPFFIYGVMHDDANAVEIMISRNPAAKVAPAVANIGAPDDAVADTEDAFFSFENIDETKYDANPCTLLGSIRMVKSASDDWTIQTIDNTDGIGQFQQGKKFNMPAGQNGSASGTFFQATAGTEPQFTTNNMIYSIGLDGIVDFTFDGGNVNVTGSGAQELQPTLPYTSIDTVDGVYAQWFDNGTSSLNARGGRIDATNSYVHQLYYVAGGTAADQVGNINTSDSYSLTVRYRAFNNG